MMSQMQNLENLRKKNLELTKISVMNAFAKDILIIECFKSIDSLNKSLSILINSLREWYSFYFPELVNELKDNNDFVNKIFSAVKKDSFGMNFSKKDVESVKKLAESCRNLFSCVKYLESYLDFLVKELCPNLYALIGCKLSAQLIILSGSLKRLAEMPYSRVQLLGAEKAFFRFIKSGERLPKHGIIFLHPLVKNNKGRASRILAEKISIASRVDFFNGEFIGDKLKDEVERRLKTN